LAFVRENKIEKGIERMLLLLGSDLRDGFAVVLF
jgi:hypothetical protein